MPSPFPGMDPYLEGNEIWPGFHQFLAIETATQLNLQVGPKYYADVEVRTVQVMATETGELVTAIEILSPYNKRGDGLKEYRSKRSRLLRSPVHLVELDLLHGGIRPGREVNEPPLDTDYVLLVNRSQGYDPRISEIWPVALSDPFPLLPIPLLAPAPDVPLDLSAALEASYKKAGYDWRIDYQRLVPPPELRPAMAEWLHQQLPQVGSKI